MKVAPGPLIGDARGSAAFVTLFLNKAGLCARIKATPYQPLTAAQFLVRASLATLSQTWKSAAMNAYRAEWIVLARANPYTDIFGVTRTLTGSAMFIKLNRNLATIGVDPIFAAPSTLAAGSPGLLTLAHIVGPPEHFNVTPTTNPALNEVPLIKASKPLSAAALTLANTETVITYEAANAPGPWDILTPYKAKHATIQTGQQIFVEVSYINNLTGYAGQLSVDSTLW